MHKTVSRLLSLKKRNIFGLELIASEFKEQLRDSAAKNRKERSKEGHIGS